MNTVSWDDFAPHIRKDLIGDIEQRIAVLEAARSIDGDTIGRLLKLRTELAVADERIAALEATDNRWDSQLEKRVSKLERRIAKLEDKEA